MLQTHGSAYGFEDEKRFTKRFVWVGEPGDSFGACSQRSGGEGTHIMRDWKGRSAKNEEHLLAGCELAIYMAARSGSSSIFAFLKSLLSPSNRR